MTQFTRDLKGYGANPPLADWPGGARLALSLVLNVEEGAEYSIENGDQHSESILSDLGIGAPLIGERNLNIESLYDYGSRVGFWRLMRLFRERNIPLTIYAVGLALERCPEIAVAIVDAGHEVASHGWRWIDYHTVPAAEEADHIRRCIAVIERLTGSRPLGWYTGRPSPNTRRLVVEEGGFLYDSDAYDDELPYWVTVSGKQHLILPYSFDNNDSRFTRSQGFDLAEEFFTYLRDGFDWLYAEGATTPRMMSVGLHCRLIGKPARIAGLARFLDHVQRHKDVWICRRVDIARHWRTRHPYRG
jgi:putative urate catabolism protein